LKKKATQILLSFALLLAAFIPFFSTSASAASTSTQTFTSSYGNGLSKYFYATEKNGATEKLYVYYNVNQNGVTITSLSPKTEGVMWPISIKVGSPQVINKTTNGNRQTAYGYCDFKNYIFKAWKLGSVYSSTDRLTDSFKVLKIDTKHKTVTYQFTGSL
jgi:hypothetical protein